MGRDSNITDKWKVISIEKETTAISRQSFNSKKEAQEEQVKRKASGLYSSVKIMQEYKITN